MSSCVNLPSTNINNVNSSSNPVIETMPTPYPLPENTNLDRNIVYMTDSVINKDNKGSIDIYKIESTGKNKEKISYTNIYPYTSNSILINPKGTDIFYSEAKNSITQINTDGTNKKVIIDTMDLEIKGFSLSKDSSKLTFSKGASNLANFNGKIGVYDLSSGEIREFSNTNGFSPYFSPDGRKIAFTENINYNNKIYVIDSDGNNLKKITDNKGSYSNIKWSPNGLELYATYLNDITKKFNIVSINLESLKVNTIIEDGSRIFDISSDGKTLAYSNASGMNLYLTDIKGKLIKSLSFPAINKVKWSPDGKKIAVLSERDISIVNTSDFNIDKITSELIKPKQNNENGDLMIPGIPSEYGVLDIDW